ncbi:MAG TPA: phosphotransferase [Rhizomicrobium sp.]|nr:phosphotransferase [Rhizomicrobium sp.]
MDTSALLRAVLAALRTDVTAGLPSGVPRHRAELIDFVLTRIAAELSAPPGWKADYLGDLSRSFENAEFARASADVNINDASDKKLHELTDQLKQILVRVADRSGQIRLPKTASEALIRGIAGAELKFRDRLEGLVKAQGHAASPKAESSRNRMTTENVTTYLQTRFADCPDIRATEVLPIAGGRSKGTTRIKLEGHPSFPAEIVLRQDLIADVGGQSVVYEYPLQKIVWQAGLPIPQPLWLEGEETFLGGPFSALAAAPGRPGGTLFRMDAPAAVARDAAQFFGRLHSLDIDEHDLRRKLLWGRSPAPVRDMLGFFYTKWTASEIEPSPLVEASFLWLYDHLDVIAPRPVFVHGDSSYHNMLVHEGRLSAVLDWEFAHAGDPAEDLVGSEHFTTEVLPWAEFMAIYRDHGGEDISRERFHFFALWRSLRFAIATAAAGHAFASGLDEDLRLAAIGYNSFPRLLHEVARQLAAACAV